MTLPLYAYELISDSQGLIVALLLGLGFGWFLERAGFGSSCRLCAQFYLYDMTVLKVMFTAIVTAAVGLWGFSALGVLDLSAVYLTPTSVGAQLLGGLLLGAGFIIGGYCPGTSVTATASGSGDGLVFILGFAAGLAIYAVAFPGLELWANANSIGEVTLPQAWGVPYGAVVLGLVVMAAIAFAVAEWSERRFAHLKPR
ncbi:sulfurtransferase [Betaproteobacteria bacterium PRO7]|nr:YeeE/YedE family protein [Burkholderiaceae bacterium]MDL1861537.1 sulfurtransferase [Betaproteobacteria bacterium PRO7]